MQGSNASWPVGGATRQSGGNWVGRFEKPEDWSIWASMYSSNLELGQLITVGNSILKWTATGVKFVDAVFATQADLDSFCSKIGTPIATGSTAMVAGVSKTWMGQGVGWVAQNRIQLNRPLLVGTEGDSTAELMASVGSVTWEARTTDVRAFTAATVATNGAIARRSSVGHLGFAVPAIYVADGGNSGYTTAELLALSKDAYSTSRGAIIDVLNTYPDIVEYNGASVNNLTAFADSDIVVPDATLELWADQHVAIVDLITATGVKCISLGIMGYSPSKSASVLLKMRNASVRYNDLLQRRWAASGNGNWGYINPNGLTCDGGAYKDGMSQDGIHLFDGSLAIALIAERKAMFAYAWFDIASSFVQSGVIYDDVGNFANPSNGLPAGYQIGGLTNCTVNTKTTTNKDFTVDFTITNANGAISFETLGSAFLGKFVQAGVSYFCSASIEIVSMSGTPLYGQFIQSVSFIPTYDTNKVLRFISTQPVQKFQRLQHIFTSPIDAADVHDWALVYRGFTGLPVGTYRAIVSPCRVVKFDTLRS